MTRVQPAVPLGRVGGVRQFAARHVLTETLSKAWHDRILGLSAEAAFWQLLSLPSLVLALLGTLGYLSSFGRSTAHEVEGRLIDLAGRVASPSVVHNVVQPTIEQVLNRGRLDVISIGFVISFWAGSSAMATFVNTITIAYGMRDLRGAVHSRLLALWLYVVSISLVVVILPMLVIGPTRLREIIPEGWRGVADDAIKVGYWPVVGGLLLAGLAALYHYATPVRLRWRRALPGALVAMLLFILGAYVLRLYFHLVAARAQTYGALAAPIAALLFFYVLALAVLLGAELNATLEKLWPRGAKERNIDRIRALLTANGSKEEKAS